MRPKRLRLSMTRCAFPTCARSNALKMQADMLAEQLDHVDVDVLAAMGADADDPTAQRQRTQLGCAAPRMLEDHGQ